ncbi:MAG TPA: hypothetical protein VFU47_09770, partial [Armatimonadota bacterium]|nr:hypothetical protein [Armatimonadota bacterium]
AWLEYCTSRWRAGGDSPQGFTVPDAATGRSRPIEFKSGGAPHQWTLRYDPSANNGGGSVTATIDNRTAVCHLDTGHKADGATFNHFGLMNLVKHADGGGEVWLDDLTINGDAEHFDRDPGWDASGNRRTYETRDIRPRFDFGFSPTHYAGGQAGGELGGEMFRGDGRYPEKMAWYADRVGPLSLAGPLHVSGRICLRRGVSDSTTLLGFFNSRTSTAISPAQDTGFPDDFFGVAVEGPSSEGFMLYPAYRVGHNSRSEPRAALANRIYPDGRSHAWRLDYEPAAEGGRVTVHLDSGSASLEVSKEDLAAPARFDRFGIVTTRIDGNGQRLYFDDLTYTVTQAP